jgi:hypothetical protein
MTNPVVLCPSEDSEPSRRSGFSSSCWSCEKVKLVFRDFPIDGLHPQARKAAVGTHADAVQKDVDEGIRLGVTGTPAFFVNGELLSGAQPLESFARPIERELARMR